MNTVIRVTRSNGWAEHGIESKEVLVQSTSIRALEPSSGHTVIVFTDGKRLEVNEDSYVIRGWLTSKG